jgi:hypothetical protein
VHSVKLETTDYYENDFTGKVGREDVFKQTVENEISKDNGTGDSIQVYLMSDHSGQQIMILTTLVMTSEGEAGSEQRSHTFHVERFSLKKLYEIEGKEQYRVEIVCSFGKSRC